MTVVSDTGPLRYLVLIGEIDVLKALYGTVFVPSAVARELSRDRTPAEVKLWLEQLPPWIEIRDPIGGSADFPRALGSGECAAILLAAELDADLLLVDDAFARKEASRRDIPVQGTLGTLVLGAKYRRIDLNGAIEKLRNTNFRASDELLNAILRDHGPRS